jgi:hypothetical protein
VVKVKRDDIVQELRDMGRNEDADRALEELPERFRLEDYEGKLHSYGLVPPEWTGERAKNWFTRGGGGVAGSGSG